MPGGVVGTDKGEVVRSDTIRRIGKCLVVLGKKMGGLLLSLRRILRSKKQQTTKNEKRTQCFDEEFSPLRGKG